MSDPGIDATTGWRERWRHRWREPVRWRHQIPLLAGLVLLWMLLWEDLSWGNLVTGAIVALVLTRLFYLPPADLSGRLSPYWALVYLFHFFVDLVKSSIEVSRLALSVRHVPRNAVIAVDLHTSSDLLMTVVANSLTLIPGSLIVDVDRLNTTLYVHVLDVPDDEAVERIRHNILQMEERLVRAIGSRTEYAALSGGAGPSDRKGA
ncbi:MAG: Na+/H+ antiporter subunit E [Actinomycetota bacterium]|nr:Na+/H+ antiporter subunit E [Actinomycetota bacterium]